MAETKQKQLEKKKKEKKKTLCTFLRTVCTGGTFGAGEVFGASCLHEWRAPEEKEKSVGENQRCGVWEEARTLHV